MCMYFIHIMTYFIYILISGKSRHYALENNAQTSQWLITFKILSLDIIKILKHSVKNN